MSTSQADTHSTTPLTGGLQTSGPGGGKKTGPGGRHVEEHVSQISPTGMENEAGADGREAPRRPAWTGTRRFLDGEFGEFFGTMILVMFGAGATAQVLLSNGTKGSYQSTNWGWGLGLMFGAFASGRSGAHMNPAVTLAQCVYRRFPWRRLPGYFAAQLLGAMTGAALVYGDYHAAIDAFEDAGAPGTRTVGRASSTAGIFATYPAAFMTRSGEFFSEFLATSMLVFLILAMVDAGADRRLLPFGLLFLLYAIGACFGWETGFAVNPARDFGPRLVTYMVGYGAEVWSFADYYFWIPIVAPFLGGLFGGFLFDVFRYDGHESPINSSPYLGLTRLVQPRKNVWSNTRQRDSTSAV